MHQPVETTKEVPIPMVQEMNQSIFDEVWGAEKADRRMYGENTCDPTFRKFTEEE